MELLIYTSYFIDPSVLCEGDLLDTRLRKVHTWLWTKDKIQEKKTLHYTSIAPFTVSFILKWLLLWIKPEFVMHFELSSAMHLMV